MLQDYVKYGNRIAQIIHFSQLGANAKELLFASDEEIEEAKKLYADYKDSCYTPESRFREDNRRKMEAYEDKWVFELGEYFSYVDYSGYPTRYIKIDLLPLCNRKFKNHADFLLSMGREENWLQVENFKYIYKLVDEDSYEELLYILTRYMAINGKCIYPDSDMAIIREFSKQVKFERLDFIAWRGEEPAFFGEDGIERMKSNFETRKRIFGGFPL